MTGGTLTLNLPEAMYEQIKQQAEEAHRSMEEKAFDVLASAMPRNESLPSEIEETLAGMRLLNDSQLWRAARSRLPWKTLAQLKGLNYKQQRDGLTRDEEESANFFAKQYQRHILIRAQVPIFNPREQDWEEHFAWTAEGAYILGKTATGRATVLALDLNRPWLVRSRRLWAGLGWHPPKD